jgi:NADPH:quinone reductase-like Zn-dependent oxidoreductase
MKAVLLRGYGDVDQLSYQDVADPVPKAGEVLVRVGSTSVNPIDYKIRSGAMQKVIPAQFPLILGRDVAGEVAAVGSGVKQFKPGDRVFGLVNHSYAEYLTAPAEVLALLPDGLDLKDSGRLPLVLLTGAQLIERGAEPSSGETVLVTGAAGSVGRTAVYVAKRRGARVLAGVKASQKAEAASLGADEVIALDDDAEIGKLPPLDVIADTVNGPTIGKLLPKLKKEGRLASVLGTPDAAAKAGIAVKEVYAQPDPDRLRSLGEDVQAGRFKIPIAQSFPLSEIREAQRAAEKGANGKVVVVP